MVKFGTPFEEMNITRIQNWRTVRYRQWHPEQQWLVCRRDVIFNEVREACHIWSASTNFEEEVQAEILSTPKDYEEKTTYALTAKIFRKHTNKSLIQCSYKSEEKEASRRSYQLFLITKWWSTHRPNYVSDVVNNSRIHTRHAFEPFL